ALEQHRLLPVVTSQRVTRRPPAARVLPSGEKAMLLQRHPHSSRLISLPVAASQRRTSSLLFSVVSPPAARTLPSGEKATVPRVRPCTSSSRVSLRVAGS